MRIRTALDRDVEAVRALFLEYAASLGFDLSFQGFDRELERLPGEYAPPRGRLLVAEDLAPGDASRPRGSWHAIGCVAVRPLEEPGGPAACEMKRLWVKPSYRGRGVGRLLAAAAVGAGRELGYARMRLDTIDTMLEAIALYRSLGFREIPPYRFNPLAGARYFEVDL